MKKLIIGILTALTFTACGIDEFLDVKPVGKIIPTTVSDFDLLMNDYQTTQYALYNMKYIDPDTFLTDDAYDELWYEYLKQNYKWGDDYYGVNGSDDGYDRRYRNIMTYNTVLADINDADLDGNTEAYRQQIKGEALGSRALDLFLLAQEYGPAYGSNTLEDPCIIMPLSVDLAAQLPRSTVQEVYTQILNDAKEALSILKDVAPVHDLSNNMRPGNAAIRALLAEVHLHMGNFSEAATVADQTLAMYDFVYDYVNEIELVDPSNEWAGIVNSSGSFIFRRLTDSESVLWNRYASAGVYRDGWHTLYHPDLVALFAEDYDNDPTKQSDQRWNFFSSQRGFYSADTDYSPNYIYTSYKRQVCVGMSVPLTILNAAESKARIGDNQGALDALNSLLRNRIIGFTDLTTADVIDVLELVKKERRKEFAATGINVVDLKRYHANGDAVDTYTRTVLGESFTLAPGSNEYIVPIYKSALDQNPNITSKPF